MGTMKISNINNIQNTSNYTGIQVKNKTKYNSPYATIPFSSAYYGKDLVSFGNRPFYETLKDNYFKLPSGYFPDEFQIEAGKGLNEGNNVLVEAPTGTGKTAIAHYAVSKNLKEGKTTFYTTPLKALSNQKLNEFKTAYGDENVGILTGDRRENVNAPILIMTTEVYRNMAVQNAHGQKNPLMENLGTVIFDEFHYLGDKSRGSVWEEALMFTPKNVQTLGLSATIGNPNELKDWMGTLGDRNVNLVSVPSEARSVPLTFDTIQTRAYEKSENYIQKKLAKTGTFDYESLGEYSPNPDLSDYKTAINKLHNEDKLPAIFFVFSKKFSRELLNYFARGNKSLTTEEEKSQIKEILEKRKKEKYIGENLNEEALLNGYAIHNAGIIPSQKELIEELFQKKLIKAVIATETLAAGINMPAKTVVISSPYKPSESSMNDEDEYNKRMLTSNEFKQMAGRAGRRGIDTEGYVYTMPTDRTSEMDFLELETMECDCLISQYEPDYSFLCSFYEHNKNKSDLDIVFSRSFYAFNKNNDTLQNNQHKLSIESDKKTKLLVDKEFIHFENGEYSLTDKGLMASKVKGYNAIGLVNLITSGKLSDITPETLALTAGAIANEADSNEDELMSDSDLSLLTGNSGKIIENIKNRLNQSIIEQLKMLGKSVNSFSNLNEILQYAQNISIPTYVEEDDLSKKLFELTEKQNKIDIIKNKTIQMEPETLANAIRNGEIIPTKVMQSSIEEVQNYKKRINAKNIETHIQNIEYEMNEVSKVSKGKKAQIKTEKKLKEMQSELDKAKTMQYIENNIYDLINTNYKFLKQNPPEQVKRDLKETQVQFAKLNYKDKLIDEIKGLIQLEKYIGNEDIEENEKLNLEQGANCIKQYITDNITLEEDEKREGLKVKPNKLGKMGAQAAYNWVLLNKVNSSSMSNWQELIKIIPEEEGNIYRSILQTADLLSQLGEIADCGMKISETQNDFKYYNQIKKSAAQARELMLKKPIEV